jgi:hypothetical protein
MGAMCWWRSWCLRASGRAERGYLVARLIFLIGTLSAHWSTARLSNPQGHWQPATWPWVLGVGVLSLTRRASPAALARGGPSTTNSFFLSNLLRHFGSSSHYGPRSRGCDFHQSDCEKPRIRLASRSFTLEAKFKGRCSSKCLHGSFFLTKATDSPRKFGSDKNGNPNYGQEAIDFLHAEIKKTDKILAVRLKGLFWEGNKVGCSLSYLRVILDDHQ